MRDRPAVEVSVTPTTYTAGGITIAPASGQTGNFIYVDNVSLQELKSFLCAFAPRLKPFC